MPVLFLFFVFVIESILIAGHVLQYVTFVTLFPNFGENIIFVRLFFALSAVSFVAASALTFWIYNRFSRFFYSVAAVWFGFLWHATLAATVFWIYQGVWGNAPLLLSDWLFGVTLYGVACAVSVYGIFHASQTVVTKNTVKLANLPEAWRGKKAVMVADFHLGQVRGEKFAERIVARINTLAPDIVFIVGDVYDGVKVPLVDVVRPFASIRAPWGTFFVTGNHEEFVDSMPYVTALRSVQVTVLMNESVVREGVSIIGITDHDSSGKILLEKKLAELMVVGQSTILLKHQPNLLHSVEQAGVSLLLSGHTHKAQVFPFTYLARLIFKGYEYGLCSYRRLQVLTTSGVGTWGPPMRVGTKSEIVLITFE